MGQRGDSKQPREATAFSSTGPGGTRRPDGSRGLGPRAQVEPAMTARQDWPSWGVDAGQRFLSPNPPAGRSDLRKGGPDPAAWWRGAFQVGTCYFQVARKLRFMATSEHPCNHSA